MEGSNGIGPAHCGARTRSGGRCKQPAGHGTEYKTGPCSKHGGLLPGPRKAAARALLLQEADRLGLAIEIEPQDLMLATVHATAGQLSYVQGRVAKVTDEEAQGSFWLQMQGEALDRAARIAKAALDAGIAERRVRLAERTGALIAAAIEDAMGEMPEFFPPEVRGRFARAVEARLAVLERTEPELLEAGE